MTYRNVLSVLLLSGSLFTHGSAGSLFGSTPTERPSRDVDILHYRIEVDFDLKRKMVNGNTAITCTPLRSSVDSVVLHAVNMQVQKVTLRGGRELRFGNSDSTLTVYFDRPYTFSDTVTFSVVYSCIPSKGLYFKEPDSTNPLRRQQIWTQGEDMDNRHWFPAWDFPNDWATSEVIATVQDTWTLLSNGKLVSVKHDKARKTKTFHWRQSKPHVAYLVMLAAGEYTIVSEKNTTIPIDYYLYPDRVEDGKRSLAATPAAMRFFEKKIGFPYPWEKYAQIYIEDFMWGGMENTGAVTLNTSYLIDGNGLLDFTADDVVAHELAHQWFGDIVTCRDWSELWLNEGFANYYEALFKKHAKGTDEFQHDMMSQQASIIGVERAQGRQPIVSGGSPAGNLYSKGAWVLYMLNSLLGDEDFDRAILHYLRKNAFSSVSTFDLMKAIEEATGQNLDWFFRQWVFSAGHPHFSVSWTWDESAKVATVTIRQIQTRDSLTGVFVVPVDIEFTTSSGKTLQRVRLARTEESVTVALPAKPLMVTFDKGLKVLKSITFPKSTDEYVYQLRHAEDVSERIAAAKSLKDSVKNPAVFAALRTAALQDAFYAVRREAAMSLASEASQEMKAAMFDLYKDPSPSVRAVAVAGLGKLSGRDVAAFLEHVCKSDSSYLVRSSSLSSLAELDSVNANDIAMMYLSRDSHRNILERGALRVLNDFHSPQALAAGIRYARAGNPTDLRLLAVGILSRMGERTPDARSLVLGMINDVNRTIRRRAIRTASMWGGDDVRLALDSRKAIEPDLEIRQEIDQFLSELTN